MNTIRIGTRESRLAVAQAELVAAAVREALPGVDTRLVKIKTTGDKLLDRTLDQIGGKGVFVKELDEALLRGEVDLCVHSYKDLPAQVPEELPLVAVSPREDPRDVLILPEGRSELEPGQPIGCSSLRRQVQLAELYPGVETAPVRGNVLTRLQKLDGGQFSGLVLAAAGIKRLGLWHRVSRAFEPEELLPAGCQGVLAIQGRAGQDYGYLRGYGDPDAWDATRAERAFVRRLDCGCGAPVGVFAQVEGDSLRVRGMITDDKGGVYRDEITGDRKNAEALGHELAGRMLERWETAWA